MVVRKWAAVAFAAGVASLRQFPCQKATPAVYDSLGRDGLTVATAIPAFSMAPT